MSEDEGTAATRRPREEWAVAFGVGGVFAGCLVAGVVFMAASFAILSLAPLEEVGGDRLPGTTGRLALLIGGFAAIGFLLVGPTVSFVVGWLLRRVRDQSLHVLAFALAGALVGAVVGAVAGGPEVANVLAAMVGASAAIGRLAVSPFARV